MAKTIPYRLLIVLIALSLQIGTFAQNNNEILTAKIWQCSRIVDTYQDGDIEGYLKHCWANGSIPRDIDSRVARDTNNDALNVLAGIQDELISSKWIFQINSSTIITRSDGNPWWNKFVWQITGDKIVFKDTQDAKVGLTIVNINNLELVLSKKIFDIEVNLFFLATDNISLEDQERIISAGYYPPPPPPPPPIDDAEQTGKNVIFTVVEKMPQFPGGDKALKKYISENLNYPQFAKQNGIQGNVYATFVIDSSGAISNVTILRGIGGGCDEEAIRLVRSMPNWLSGEQSGKKVTVQYNMPIKFTL